jgi:UDP-glucose 4-epimerase
MVQTVLVTGGAGYIGSHTCLELLESGYRVFVIDNLSNSDQISLKRVQEIANKELFFIKGDVRDFLFLNSFFSKNKCDSVIHFAGLKSVSEANLLPAKYYDYNVAGSINLIKAMGFNNVKQLVFSSSATVYGSPKTLPIPETAQTSTTNPYGQSKLIVEKILSDVAKSDSNWKIANLRYFNPVGAHSSGIIGEDPQGSPNNIMPYISQVAVGILEKLRIFGMDYETKDGTGVRDYIHVSDLAKGHIAALNYIQSGSSAGFSSFNLGRGEGVSVLQLLDAFEQASGRKIPYEFVERRPGDVAECYADPTLANTKLGWKAELGIKEMCEDAWRWQKNNPNGYRSEQ